MTQQESEFNLYFLGSTARSIINECQIPVMSVRPVKNWILLHTNYSKTVEKVCVFLRNSRSQFVILGNPNF